MAATKRRRFMVNIPPEMAPGVLLRAASLRRSVSNYIEWLITRDLAPDLLSEDAGTYDAGAKNRDVVTPMIGQAEQRAASQAGGARATGGETLQSNPPRPAGQGRGKARA